MLAGYGDRSYEKVAIRAIEYIEKKGCLPRSAWNEAAGVAFGLGTWQAKKGCPRSAFLGLCEDGLVKGVSAGSYVFAQNGKKLNKEYAVAAVGMLCEVPSAANGGTESLWRMVMRKLDENIRKHHDYQMNVVLGLWHAKKIKCPEKGLS